MNRLRWCKSLALTCVGLLSIISCADKRSNMPPSIKISNRTGRMWIWVTLNKSSKETYKIWRSHKVPLAITIPGKLSLRIYLQDPARSNVYQEYIIEIDNFNLEDGRYSIEIRDKEIIYRFVGRDGFKQQKLKRKLTMKKAEQ